MGMCGHQPSAPRARCDRKAQVKRGAIKELILTPKGGKMGALRKLSLNRKYPKYEDARFVKWEM